jgi:hypothetical protein
MLKLNQLEEGVNYQLKEEIQMYMELLVRVEED